MYVFDMFYCTTSMNKDDDDDDDDFLQKGFLNTINVLHRVNLFMDSTT